MSQGFWDVPISEQSLLSCTVPSVETFRDETVDGPLHLSWATKSSYSPCAGSDPVLAWLDMGPTASLRRVGRSELPYTGLTSKRSAKAQCEAARGLTYSNTTLSFAVRSYKLSTSGKDATGRATEDFGLSVFALPADNIGLIKQAIYSGGTISAGFFVYDGMTGSPATRLLRFLRFWLSFHGGDLRAHD